MISFKKNFFLIIKKLIKKLIGSACNIVKYKTLDDWDNLKEYLESQFLDRRTLAQLQCETTNIKRYPHEEEEEEEDEELIANC